MTAACPEFSRSVPVPNLFSPCQTMYPNFAFGKCGHQIFQTLDQHIHLGDRTSHNNIDEYVSEK